MENKKLNPKIIEFFGPSGAGKTTTARRLAQVLTAEYLEFSSLKEQRYYFWLAIWRRPGRAIYLIIYTIWEGRSAWSLLRHKLFLLSTHLAMTEKAHMRTKQNQIVILDGGLGQYALSLYEHHVTDQELSRYVRRHLGAHVYIMLSAAASRRWQRMKVRGRQPRQKLPINHDTWQEIMEHNTDKLIKVLPRELSQALILSYTTDELTTELLVNNIRAKIQAL
ncbi:MAG: hypothetical protein AAB677_01790 [Patescibacteria group bacterium]